MEGKVILITGGTGSFGKAFVPMTLKRYKVKKILIYSRDEMKQWELAKLYQNNAKVDFVIGDVRDRSRLTNVLENVDYVVHAAATKIIPTAEYNPIECVKTNIEGATNLIDSSIRHRVKKVVALSTDKASNPINLYGATKLVSDKLFVAGNASSGARETIFSVVRYGNVMGSRGSVIPFFHSLKDQSYFPITDLKMTRFMITLEDAVKLVWHAFNDMKGGEIYVKKIPSMSVVDIATAINERAEHRVIGIRPGEKVHEQMIGFEDAPHTYEYDDHFKILPAIYNWSSDPNRNSGGKKVDKNFVYSSLNNKHWMTVQQLRDWIKKNIDVIGKI